MRLSARIAVVAAVVALGVVPVAAAAASDELFHPDQRLSKGWFGVLTYKFVRDEIPGGGAALGGCDRSNRFDDLGGESQFKRDALNCLADMGYFDEVPAPGGSSASGGSFHPDQRLSKGWFGVLTYKFVRDGVPGGRAALSDCAPAGRFSDLSSESSFKQDALTCLAGLGYFDQVPLPDGSLPGWRSPVARQLARLNQAGGQFAAAIIAMPWFEDGVTETEAGAVRSLARLVDGDDAGGGIIESVAARRWFGDGIDETEHDLLVRLADLYARSRESAAAVAGMPFLSSVERDDVLAVRSLEQLAGARDRRLEAVLAHPDLRGGITDGDTTLVAAAGAVRGAGEVRRLIGGGRVEAVSAATGHTPGLEISVVRSGTQPRQSTIDAVTDAAAFVERVMDRPLPVGHIIVVVDAAADDGANNGFALGVRPDAERHQSPYEEFSFRSRIVGQTARFFWRAGPPWLDDGAAGAVEYLYGADAGVSPGLRRIPRRGECEVRNLETLAHRDAAPGRQADDGCSSFLGQSLFLELLEETGPEAFSAGLGRLHRLTHETPADPAGDTPGIGQVREAFPDHAAVVEQHWSGAPDAPEQRPSDEAEQTLRLVRWDWAPSRDGTFVTFSGTLLGDAVLFRETLAQARAGGRNFTLHAAGRLPIRILPPPPPPDNDEDIAADDYNLNNRTFSVRFRFPQALGDPSDYTVVVWGYRDQTRSSIYGPPADPIGDPLGAARIRVE